MTGESQESGSKEVEKSEGQSGRKRKRKKNKNEKKRRLAIFFLGVESKPSKQNFVRPVGNLGSITEVESSVGVRNREEVVF